MAKKGSAENTRISTRFENQTAPVITSVKKRPEKSEKQMGPSSLKRSERGKSPDDVPASKESAEDVNNEMREVGGRKRKRFNAIRFKALFKPQRVQVESDDEEDSEDEDGTSTSETKTNSNRDGDEADGQSVQRSRDKTQKAVLKEGLKATDQEEQVGGNCSSSNGHIADSDNHVSRTSLSRTNHVLENQQELDFHDKVMGTCEPAGSIVNSSKFVEYWVPVQLSNAQLEQYCASLLSNATVFQSCSKRATDEALLEILNSNRKCCNHPYLVDAKLQEKIMKDFKPIRILDYDIKVSGKLQFLDLVLPEVKKRQLRVLILYQSTSGSASVGHVLAEFVHQRFGEDSYECLDGVGIVSSKKQTALSNFNNDKNRFIFLLVSNACNSTIKLSSIDLVIIFDSDLNPSADIKLLQKISIDSQTEQVMVVRLYTASTLEEKILKLADHDNMVQNLRSKYDELLMWGASDLFNRLQEFHSQSDNNISSEESTLDNVVKEFLHIISRKSESDDDTTKSFITRVESCGSYGKNIMFHSETKSLLSDGDQPRVFWKKLLEGRNPVWRFRSESTPRQRKRPNFFSDSCGENPRKKTLKNVVEGETVRSNEGVPVQNESQLSSGDHFWSTAVGNETSVGNEKSLYDLLKPTVSELCKKLKFSDNVTTIVESFLKFVIENLQVFKEHTSTLQALMISVCWIGSSLSGYMIDMIDRAESFALAKKDLNFICSKEEADQVYDKLQSAKETFLQNKKDLEIVNNIEEPRMSNSVPLDPQESKPENRHSSNEETLQSNEQKDENEIDKFNRVWDQKRMDLEKNRQMDEAFIRLLHPTKSSLRSEKLNSVQKDFAKKLEEHERLRASDLSDLKAKLEAAVGQVAVNGDQGSPSEAQIHDKSLHEMSPVVAPTEVIVISDDDDDDDSDRESIGSHSSENQTADALVKSEPIGDDLAIVSSIPIEENASELHDEDENDLEISIKLDADMENDKAGQAECVEMEVLEAEMEMLAVDNMSQAAEDTVRTSHDCVTPDAESADMPNGTDMERNLESTDGSHAVEGPVGTSPNGVAPHVESMEPNLEPVDESHAVGDPNASCPVDVAPPIENADDGTVRTGTSQGVEDRNLTSGSSSSSSSSSSTDVAHAVSDHSVPPIHDIESECLQAQQPPDSGIQDQEVQAKSTPVVQIEDNNLRPVDMGQVDQIMLDDSLPDPNNEPFVVAETPIPDPVITENQSAILPVIEVLAQTSSEPLIINPTITENQIAALSMSEDLAQTAFEPVVAAVETPIATDTQIQNASPREPDDGTISASTSHVVSDDLVPVIQDNENGSLQVQHLPDSGIQDQEVQAEATPMVEIEDNNLQSVDMEHRDPVAHTEPFAAAETLVTEPMVTEDQPAALPASDVLAQTTSEPSVAAATPMTVHTQIQNASQIERVFDHQRNGNINQPGSRRMYPGDPLHLELQRLHSGKENMVKMHQENMQKISADCEKEIAEVTAQIKLKYGNKRQEAEIAFNSQYQKVESNMQKVAWNKVLAAAFRSKCKDLAPDHAGLQQAPQAELMHQLHRFPGPSSVRRSPGQSSGTQQSPTPPPPPPPPISAAAPLSPPPSMPPQPPPQRAQPPLQIVDNASALFSTPVTRRSHTTNLGPQLNPNPIPSVPSTTTTSVAAPTSSPIRLPHGSNHLSPSTTPLRPPIRLGTLDMSAANLRINTETRGQSPHSRGVAPHMRPIVSRELRSPGPHFRPVVRSDIRSPAPHVVRSFASPGVRFAPPHMRFRPTSEPSTSQPPVSASPPPPPPRSASPQPPPPPPQSSQTSRQHLQRSSNYNLNVLMDNVARRIGGNAAQTSSATEVVCLSDDE